MHSGQGHSLAIVLQSEPDLSKLLQRSLPDKVWLRRRDAPSPTLAMQVDVMDSKSECHVNGCSHLRTTRLFHVEAVPPLLLVQTQRAVHHEQPSQTCKGNGRINFRLLEEFPAGSGRWVGSRQYPGVLTAVQGVHTGRC